MGLIVYFDAALRLSLHYELSEAKSEEQEGGEGGEGGDRREGLTASHLENVIIKC